MRSTTPRWRIVVSAGVAAALEVALVLSALRLFTGWPRAIGLLAAVVPGVVLLVSIAALSGVSPRRATSIMTGALHALVLTLFVVGVYLVVVAGFGHIPRRGERELVVLSMIAAVLVASGWRPVRRWIEGRTRQLGARRGPATGRSLDSFGEQLSRAIPMDELLLQLAEALSHSLRLARAEVWSGSGELMRRTASVPHRELAELRLTPEEARVIARAGVSSRAWAKVWLPTLIAVSEGRDQRVAPLAHGDELLGLIVVERDRIEGAFRGDEERVLGEVARRMGLALHNVALDSALQVSLSELRDQARELRDSRKRVVTAADGERRRIERDLHDGAQQRLIGLDLKVGLMRRVSDARETPESLLDDLDREVHDALDELRRLAHGIYPPLLADGGLSAALAEAARRSPIPAHLHADELGRFHPDAEAAVYFCCLEALQNAAKHAGEGATATVRVWGEQDALLFEVADDGAGFGDEPLRPGAGLHNMTDRVGALGGSLDVRSRPERAGTEIRGRIPLAPGEHRIGEHERGRPAPAL